jgi:hypothetical protein
MAICKTCQREMTSVMTITCKVEPVTFPDGAELPQVPFNEPLGRGRCHDCGIALGGVHHPGCDAERCPKCDGQLISCGCLSDLDHT